MNKYEQYLKSNELTVRVGALVLANGWSRPYVVTVVGQHHIILDGGIYLSHDLVCLCGCGEEWELVG